MATSARRVLILGLVAALAGAGLATATTNARFTDADDSGSTIGTDTLSPPTSLVATGGTLATLTWIPSVDVATTGYEIRRSPTSGSGYALVGTATPGTATGGTDVPATAGAYFYVVRSVFQNWRSVDSNEASAIIILGPATTGFRSCAAGTSTPTTGGDGDGYETNPDDTCIDDGIVATDGATGTTGRSAACSNLANDRHVFRDFAFGLPGTIASIDGIEIQADLGLNNNGGLSRLCVELSPDGGATWTAAKAVTMSSSALTTYLFGSAGDLWGRTWTAAEFADATFRVRLTDATTQPNKDYRLDYLGVQVSYTP
ncbi:MAG TPA: hypothetical protein VFO73_07160 [Candidatus Limnocylindrales bacterium]|nr:hypothetical protein [Candidatus Limnocylindrales bacterium]